MIQLKNISIGTDLVTIDRIEKVFLKYKKSFAQKILSARELKEFELAKAPVNFLAKRFAAKEAAVKALGTGFADGVSFQDIILEHNSMGAPLLKLEGRFAHIASLKNLSNWQISLSDNETMVLAFVVAI